MTSHNNMNHCCSYPRSKEELLILLQNDHRVKIAGVDIDGVLRGKVISKTKFLSSVPDGLGYCSVVFGWDLHDAEYKVPTAISNADNGYTDITAIIDLTTFRRIPWEDNIPFFLVTFFLPNSKTMLHACSRGLLKRIVEDTRQLGFEPMVGLEYEWYNYKETPESLAEKNYTKPQHLTPGMFGYSLLRPTLYQDFFYDLFDQCGKFNIPLEGLHTETGPGVYEAALEYTNAMEACDRAQLFKTSAKQLGSRYGIIPSFMAKPVLGLPGCSGHVHMSLRALGTSDNVFQGKPGEDVNTILGHFIAGVLKGLPSILPLMAPTVNSYKRLVEHYWAPTVVCWGKENRTAAVRLIAPPTCSPSSTRIEIRVPGADANAYLAVAGILACGVWGIKEKLPLPDPAGGDATKEAHFERLAANLKEATEVMAHEGSVARQVLGDAFVDHYVATRRHEWQLWSVAVTDWELKRYMELI